MKKVSIDTIEGGVMTKDLSLLCEGKIEKIANSGEFIKAIAAKLA